MVWILLGVIILLIGITLAILLRSYTPKIGGINSIASLEEIELGGLKQTILIRGKDKINPILLYLHGGPGMPLMPFAHVFDRKLEEKFVVVHWDQRGAGKTYTNSTKPEDLKIEKYVSDTYELIKYLCNRFDKEKVFLIGHSWGSYLGSVTAYRHPELLNAYIGMGQVINQPVDETISYNYVMEKARINNNQKAINDLEKIGLPPYDNADELVTERNWLYKYGGIVYNLSFFKTIMYAILSPEYSIWDHIEDSKGTKLSLSSVNDEFRTVNIEETIKKIDVPVYFLEGRHDYCVPSELVEEYVDMLEAPHKEIIWFENSAHMIPIEETELYQDVLINKVHYLN